MGKHMDSGNRALKTIDKYLASASFDYSVVIWNINPIKENNTLIEDLKKVGDKIELDDMILAVTAADKRKIKKIGITIKTNT